VKHKNGDLQFDTQADVELHAGRKLTDIFKLARDAPISSGKLFDDIGYLGDTACTRAILEGTITNFLVLDFFGSGFCKLFCKLI
jgi:hypothetical protein